MTNNVKKETKKGSKKSELKACAILYPITAALWVFNAVMVFWGSLGTGKDLGWNFWMDICIAVVFGSLAVDYIIKYKKEVKESQANVTVL